MCDQHLHAGNFIDPETDAPGSAEAYEIKRRWPVALRELKSLLDRMKDWQKANPEKLHPNLSKIEKKQFREVLMAAILADDKPALKRSVVRKMADKIGDYLLWRRESSIPVIHELIVLLPWWISHFPGEVMPKIRDIGLENILKGIVVPVQRVWREVLSADPVYLGHCACRSAGVVDDLKKDGRVFQMVSEADGRRLLDRFVDRYQDLKRQHGRVPDTDPESLSDWRIFRDDYLRDLPTLLENAEGDTDSLIGMGHSLGAVTTLMAAIESPSSFRALVLIEPTLFQFWQGALMRILAPFRLFRHSLLHLAGNAFGNHHASQICIARWNSGH